MTPSVADKTSSSVKLWRRHTDPPSFWVAVFIGSLSLHLLAFWLIRSYQSSLLWRQQSKAAIPVEVIEIASQPKSKAKTRTQVIPVNSQTKPVSTNQKLQPKNSSKPIVVKTDRLVKNSSPTVPDKNAVAFAEQRQRQLAEQQQRELAEQRQRQLVEQQQREAEQRQRQLAEQQQREAEQRQRQLAEQQQREAEQRQRQLAEQQQRELAEQQQRELAEQRQRQLAEQQQRENSGNLNNPESPPTPSNTAGGSLVASLVGEPQQEDRGIIAHPAKIKPSNQPFRKGLEYVKYIEKKIGEPVEVTALLTISEKGKLELVTVLDKNISEEEKSYYEDFLVSQVLNNWEFEPAYDKDPNDPKPSNLIVRIRLQPLP
ncbi:hypothetical protein NIES37_06840 [Tolypothrix tenuis PCC 7101]|uniref:TonB C-terminal domain-containing protein n=1 Tax=Tolypothrix tenuis PCC 7101 TaxID=231146 RepID=A0A1Z4MTD9_9CYAN|nr:hypothetical protein [Aulosira sp. FACHB-113]BAY96748.1 hypothetical protein NIES37_06840 [Tolypothrix tenuis PCC 7101]BAZ72744.1 hypothetical protein NIES50_12990 [Aulosira laxa NIES-50]